MNKQKQSFKTLLLSLLFVQIVSSFSYSQNDIFTNYSVKEGLPSNQVYKTIQDNIGNVWFLTDMGISKYDGYEFENFSEADGLTDNVFFDAQKHENGSIWLLGMNGLITIITESKIKPFEHNNKLDQFNQYKPIKLFLTKKILKIYYKGFQDYLQIDYDGKIIFHPQKINANNRHYLIDSDNMFYRKNDISKPSKNFLYQSAIITKPFVRDYGFFMPNKETLILLIGKDTVKIKNQSSTKIIIFENYLKAGIIDTNHFWVSSKNNGLSIFNKNGKRTKRLLIKNTISDIWLDGEKNMWISTLYDGVYKQQKTIVQNIIQDKNVRQLDKNRIGNLYLSFNNGNIYKKIKSKYTIIAKSIHGDPSSIIFTDTLFYYIDNYLYSENNPVPLNNEKVTSRYDLTILSNNSFGISNSSGFDILKEKINNHIFFGRTFSSIIYKEKILLGTNKGLYYQSNKQDSISFIKMKVYEKRINKIIFFKNHIILGTQGQGVIILNKKLSKIITKIKGEKIAGNFISNLIIKNDSTIWVTTNQGFSELTFNSDFELIRTITVNQNQGLSSPQVNDIEIINDTLWIATKNGLFKMSNEYFNTSIRVKNYKLHFTELKVNDISNDKASFKTLNYNENRLSISFSTIDFNDLKNVYRYKLFGADSTWNYSKDRKSLYSNLSPGKYIFKVQVKGENQSWLENEISLIVQISPPFWKTWWFILPSIGLLILIIYLFFKYKILLYNKDIVREMMRYFLKRIKIKEQPFIIVREGNIDVKIVSHTINYVKAEKNYIMIFHDKGKTLSRLKISEFLTLVPDPIEYIQVRRSYIVRIDKIDRKGKKEISISGHIIKIGTTFAKEIENISF